MSAPEKPTNAAASALENEAVTKDTKDTKGKGVAKADNTVTAAGSSEAPKLSGAELKKRAKEEKAARRAQAQQEKFGGAAPPAAARAELASQAAKLQQKGQQKGKDSAQGQQKRTGSSTSESRQLPIRGQQSTTAAPPPEEKKENKNVRLFGHLYSRMRTTTLAGISKEVHPSVQATGLQMSNYEICGSNARFVATLESLKRVIESYTTPPGNTLTRHLTSHVLSPQIDFLASCRPLSVSMGNAIRWLKLEISKVDIDVPDAEAKEELCAAIDEFIRNKVTLADTVIAESAAANIRDGDVILTHAKSSIVEKAIVKAYHNGRKFKVIIVDSRPLHEGQSLARSLVQLPGLEIKLIQMSGLSHNIADATKVLVGAHAMMSNGRLYSRCGTAQVAMEAYDHDCPVIVLCESIKFTEKVALDSIVMNEIAPPDELLLAGRDGVGGKAILAGWKEQKNLQLLNLLYDVTPAEYIKMVITEFGVLPPSSVPVVHRLGNEGQ